VTAAALLAGLTLLAGSVPAAPRRAAPSLKRALDGVLERRSLASAHVALAVRDLASGEVLYGRNADKSVVPASVLKLVTAAAALDAYGPDARVRTTLEAAGPVAADGTLRGDLYLVGRGDPNLSGRFADGRVIAPFEALGEALWATGLRRVEGRIVGHDGLFVGNDRRGQGWAWDDLVWWYGAEVSALSFNDNCADLRIAPGARPGDALVVERDPVSAYYSVESMATTSAGGTRDDLVLVRELGSSRIRLSGTYPVGAGADLLHVALEDPARYAATVLAEVLAARGIAVTGGASASAEPLPAGTRVLVARDSAPLSLLIQPVNKKSQNLHAELLLRLLGLKARGEGSAKAGLEAEAEFLKRLGISTASWALFDGSGLSRSNLVTAAGLVSLLAAMDKHPYGQAYRESLPIAGVDGSLSHRMARTAARGRVFAKTGGLSGVSSLAGYVDSRSGRRLAFAAFVNLHAGRPGEAADALNDVAVRLAGL
jgi:D-alanyl-D-alanine carboxypeptidase/D-alanyl-D-alanine-endopeptidase (penicillin-binding protein 4)